MIRKGKEQPIRGINWSNLLRVEGDFTPIRPLESLWLTPSEKLLKVRTRLRKKTRFYFKSFQQTPNGMPFVEKGPNDSPKGASPTAETTTPNEKKRSCNNMPLAHYTCTSNFHSSAFYNNPLIQNWVGEPKKDNTKERAIQQEVPIKYITQEPHSEASTPTLHSLDQNWEVKAKLDMLAARRKKKRQLVQNQHNQTLLRKITKKKIGQRRAKLKELKGKKKRKEKLALINGYTMLLLLNF